MLLSLIVFIPLLGALVILFLGRADEGIRKTAFGVATLDFLISLILLVRFDKTTADMQFVKQVDWIPNLGIQYYIGVDGISILMIFLTALLFPISILASWKSIKNRVQEYMIALLVLETGVLGVFVSLDFFLFYVFWEVMLIPMALLIGIWGSEGKRTILGRWEMDSRVYAAIKFFLYTLGGSLLMLVAIISLYFAHQQITKGALTFNMLELIQSASQYSPRLQFWMFWAFFLAFAIKVPMFPFHTWLPDAHVEAPTAGSVILAGVLLKMGTYGFLRICLPLIPEVSKQFASLIIVLAVIAIIYGALVAMVQPDLKKLIAYSSVSHMGFVMLGMFAFTQQGVEGAILQMFNHGIITGALFLIVGLIYDRTHTRLIANFGGLSKVLPVYAAFFGIFTFASLGLPGLGGFIGEFLILVGTFRVKPVAATLATIGIILGAAYMLWMFQRVMLGEITHSENQKLQDLNRRELATLIPLLILVFWIGIYPNTFLRFLHPSVENLMKQMGTQAHQIIQTAAK
jgi:NADH-quinone oxidoreductase subunit M